VNPYPFLTAWREGVNVTPLLSAVDSNPEGVLYIFPIDPKKDASFAESGYTTQALDIFAESGAHFLAVTDGVVNDVSYSDRWEPGVNDQNQSGGLWVSIIGVDGIRYYGAHLSAINPVIHIGSTVRAGDLLGLVGNSGNARFTLPHLHFEILLPPSAGLYPSEATRLDPYPFVLAWYNGEDVTPQK
jgi:murein DD-endopeptidase MepM/ murein hydrolase activator NlpD